MGIKKRDLNGSILINLVFDPALKPELASGTRAFSCGGCVTWHLKNIYFRVPPHTKTLQDLAEVIMVNHGIQSDIILSNEGTALPLDFPCKVLTNITGPIDVLPMTPIVKVVAPQCTCAAAATEAFESMMSQFGDTNIDEVSTKLTDSSSSIAEMPEKSGRLKRAAAVSRLDEIKMDERDGGVESLESSSTSKGDSLGNTSDEASVNATSDLQNTNSDDPGLTSGSSNCTLGSKVYDADQESTEKSTEDMEASEVSGKSSQGKESPEETAEGPNADDTFIIPNQGQVTSAEPSGSSWAAVSSNDQCEQVDETQNETQVRHLQTSHSGSGNLDDSSENMSGDAAVASGSGERFSVMLQNYAQAPMEKIEKDNEESSANITIESFDMFEDSAETSRAKRHRLSMSLDESERVLKKLKTTDPANESFLQTLLTRRALHQMSHSLESGDFLEENWPITSTPNSTVDFSAVFGGGELEACGASDSEIELTEDLEMEISTKLVSEDLR